MLKVQLWTPDTCGCTFHQAFDDNVPEHLLPGTQAAQIYHALPIEEAHFVTHEEATQIVQARRNAEARVWDDVQRRYSERSITPQAGLTMLGLPHTHTVHLNAGAPRISTLNNQPQPKAVTCRHHSKHDSPKHYDVAKEENVRKNLAIQAISGGVRPLTLLLSGVETEVNPSALGIDYRPMWAYDEKRQLHVSHTHIKTHAILQALTLKTVQDVNAIVHHDHKEFDWTSCEFNG